MNYEWDEAKRLSNLAKHGYDFTLARRIYEQPNVMRLQSPRPGESRYVDLAVWDGKVLALVYTMREGAVRVISLRPADTKERRLYHGKNR